MKAEITFTQLYWNFSLMDFFFREQSKNTVDDLMENVEDPKTAIEKIDEYASVNDCELDDIEEMFKGEDFDEIYTALRFSEGPEWLTEYNELFNYHRNVKKMGDFIKKNFPFV